MATAIAPRKPQSRGDVESRTPLRVRERIATVRWYLHVYPFRAGFLTAVPTVLTLEHYQTTFPAIASATSATVAGLGAFTSLWG